MKIGIIGAGWIAAKMARTLQGRPEGCEVYAVASRSLEKARAFAGQWGATRAYGSYEELVCDPQVDLVYIATPHSHHYQHARLAIEHGKPCLVEKAFTANAREAAQLLDFAHERRVFVTEAIWTRYMPLSLKIKELLDAGAVGEPHMLQASLFYMISHKERIVKPELCGGALLDIGIYPLNFARMYFGTNVESTSSICTLGPSGVDLQESISLTFAGGRMASLQASTLCLGDKKGVICGSEGYIVVDNINCPELVQVYRGGELVESYAKPSGMISGYEYQVFECKRCIEAGLLESPLMPHAETLAVMRQMDTLRAEWGVKFPMD